MEPLFVDMLGRAVRIAERPKRIISLVPSQTELLHHLGLDERVLGVTRFCTRPANWSRSKQRIGGTKSVNLDVILNLQPDLIIGNKEENLQSDILELEKHFPVWMSDIETLDDACRMIEQIGTITDTETEANRLSDSIKRRFRELTTWQHGIAKPTAAYIIWKEPYMVAGRGTFIGELLDKCGIRNVFSDLERYPSLTREDIIARNPDFILFSSEPFPFNEDRLAKERENFSGIRCLIVDGELFSWYGPRLLETPEYSRRLHGTMREMTIL